MRISWDANNWVLQLFYQFLDSSTAKTLNISEFEEGQSLPKATRGAFHPSPVPPALEPTSTTTSLTSALPIQDELSTPVTHGGMVDMDFMSQLLNIREEDDTLFLSPTNFMDLNGSIDFVFRQG